jgi:hypothetical protein
MTTTGVGVPGWARTEARTLRTDRWCASSVLTAAALLVVIVNLTWVAFLVNADYYWAPNISPLHSPCLTDICNTGSGWGWFPRIAPVTPAIIVLVAAGAITDVRFF